MILSSRESYLTDRNLSWIRWIIHTLKVVQWIGVTRSWRNKPFISAIIDEVSTTLLCSIIRISRILSRTKIIHRKESGKVDKNDVSRLLCITRMFHIQLYWNTIFETDVLACFPLPNGCLVCVLGTFVIVLVIEFRKILHKFSVK